MTPGPTTAGGAERERLTVADALAAVLGGATGGADGRPLGDRASPGAAVPLGVERVPLDAALGRVLAEDVRAPADVPPWPNASMDGYAVRAADVLGAAPGRPARLRVVGAAYAGAPSDAVVGPGLAVRIATGAPLPPGADAVVRVEDTREADGSAAGTGIDASPRVEAVEVLDDRDASDAPLAGGAARRNVRPPGEDVRAGAVAAEAGTRVTPGVVGLLAAVGAAEVVAARRPRVGILASGDELVPLARAAEARGGRAVVSANTHALAALVREAGGVPVDLGIAADTEAALGAGLARARAAACDVVLTTGGVSVGERDHVRPAVRAAGGRVLFWRVRMRPGGPLAFGLLPAGGSSDSSSASSSGDGPRLVPWLGLPGNPVSTVVTFVLFVRPLLSHLLGDRRPFPRCLTVTLAEPVRAAAPLTHLLRATLDADDAGGLCARLTGPQGSGLLSSVARADAYVVVPAHVDALDAGARVWAVTASFGDAAGRLPAGVWDQLPDAA